MVQSIDLNKPVYNSVNISIRKPEVNAGKTTPTVEVNNDNGIYNAVKIDIDRPKVNTEPQKVYDYPEADGIVTYDMLNLNAVALPEKVNNENIEIAEEVAVPEANYTTVEAEKAENAEIAEPQEETTALSFKGAEEAAKKKPEIVPSEPILPSVNIAVVNENLNSEDRDIQAKQIEEIVRTAIFDEKNAKDYVVSDVFSSLIKITEEDVTKLQPPTKEQIQARKKLEMNILAVEKDQNAINNLPYKMSDEEIALATNLSPLEVVERNKDYAITALGALAEIFIKDYKEKEGLVLPITDVPGVSAIVNSLRKDPDPGVRLAAIDALRHIKRPEYKEEIDAIFTLAQTDTNPAVARMATIALKEN